jgi:Rod binding domain-containing protein
MAAPLAAALATTAAGRLAHKGGTGHAASALEPTNPKEAKARKTAQDFESMFLEQTFERLFATGGPDGPLGDNGAGGEVYRSMLVKEYAGNVAKSGGVGIADQVYREILKMQESQHVGRS